MVNDQMKPCSNDGCTRLLFQWDQEHEYDCFYKPSKCQFCNDFISKASLTEHYKECQIPWINENDPKEGSTCLVEYCRRSKRGLQIELDSVRQSFAVIGQRNVMLFKRDEVEFRMDVMTTANGNKYPTEITYWLPQDSNTFDVNTTISLREGKEWTDVKLSIPLETVDLLIDSSESNGEQDGMDRFFQQLLDRRDETELD
jgi:hypothetical protein